MRPHTKHFQQKPLTFSRYEKLKRAVFATLAIAFYFAALLLSLFAVKL